MDFSESYSDFEAGDKNLKEWIENSRGNALLTSKITQNELIEVIQELIQKQIVYEILKCSGMYGLMADETTDLSRCEQVSVTLRYVTEEGMIREMFVGFESTTELTGQAMANHLKTVLSIIGYDRAASLQGRLNGCAALLRREQPLALNVHCFNHRLNLCLNRSCGITEMRNLFTTIAAVSDFFLNSAQLWLYCSSTSMRIFRRQK